MRRILLIGAAASVALTGCGKLWPFSETTHYTIGTTSQDETLHKYLSEVLKDKLEAKLYDVGDAEVNQRREDYREQQIKTDLQKALEAKGYYNGRVVYADDNTKKFSGVYEIDAGQKFTIASVRVEPKEFADSLNLEGIDVGAPLDAVNVLTAQQALRDKVRRGKCYFTLDVENAVRLNKDKATGDIVFNVAAGREGHFGPVTFVGQNSVNQSYLKKLVPWKEGGCYRTSRVEALKTSLLESGLFSRADIILPEEPLPNGEVPIEIQLSARAPRTIKAGANYYSDEGLGTTLGWEHRNFFGSAEKLNVDLNVSKLKQSLEAKLNKPYFLRKDQNLSLNTDIRRQDTDAYEEIGIGAGADITRTFSRYLSGSGGVAFNLTQITDKANPDEPENTYALTSLPFTLTYDNRRNKLDPQSGWLLSGSLEPFIDALGESDPFLKAQVGASTYIPFDADAKYVLALRANTGSILGSGVVNIPPTERFYAGGGGSVRGYGYQEVGPKDGNGDPTGGRSMVNASTEFRIKFTDKIGGVGFVDAGSVSDDTIPSFSNVAIGAGIGARYYTGFGPLRFDIAVPLTEKEDLEQQYQFYISIGQAF